MEQVEDLRARLALGDRLVFSHEGKDLEGVVTFIGKSAGAIALTVEVINEVYELFIEGPHVVVVLARPLLAA